MDRSEIALLYGENVGLGSRTVSSSCCCSNTSSACPTRTSASLGLLTLLPALHKLLTLATTKRNEAGTSHDSGRPWDRWGDVSFGLIWNMHLVARLFRRTAPRIPFTVHSCRISDVSNPLVYQKERTAVRRQELCSHSAEAIQEGHATLTMMASFQGERPRSGIRLSSCRLPAPKVSCMARSGQNASIESPGACARDSMARTCGRSQSRGFARQLTSAATGTRLDTLP